jgi:hypothetical protein
MEIRFRSMIVFGLLIALLAAGMAVRPAQAVPPHCRLMANAGWIDCQIDMVAGTPTTIGANGVAITGNLRTYPGAISGPDGQATDCFMFDGISPCALEGAPYGALLGKIGPEGEPFVIGSNLTFIPSSSGHLYVAVNDNLPFYEDNHGAYWVYWLYTP